MRTRYLVLLLIPLMLIAWVLLAMVQTSKHDRSVSVASPVMDPAVAETVEAFGSKLQKVSLLAPAADVKAAMDREYAAYVSPQLLVQWEADPENALGRTTSSPWPDRIQVHTAEPQADGTYLVRGVVVEVVNGSSGSTDIVATYPITLTLNKAANAWLITSAEKGAYSEIPHQQVILGVYTCLPHRDQSGPQTMECALGLKEDTRGEYYSIDTGLMSSNTWMGLPTGSHIRVQGVMVPTDQLNSTAWQKYDIVGIISATMIEEI
ncbi:MAG: hypothetical protein JWM46_140 [Candidatus Kaiserbacteria bacterium]|nr:hypothetical protein [Candidatus Kaiserbacteria bacterium]